MSERQARRASNYQRLAAQFLLQEANTYPLITVTDCTVSDDLTHATIFIAVTPPEKADEALTYLKRKRSDLREYIKKHSRSKHTPTFEVAPSQNSDV